MKKGFSLAELMVVMLVIKILRAAMAKIWQNMTEYQKLQIK